MNVSYDEALHHYSSFPIDRRVPSLHPYYIYADALREPGLQPVFFVFQEQHHLFYHAFLRGEVEGTPYFDVQSPYGYGGPISTTSDSRFLQAAWGAYQEWCRQHAVMVEFVRFHPLLQNGEAYYGESIRDRETVWVDLKVTDLLASYKTRARTAVRKAIKNGLYTEIVQGSGRAEAFLRLYRDTMKSLHADSFYFFPAPYVEKILDWDQSYLIHCKADNEIIATAIFLTDGDRMEYHLSASNAKGKDMGATNLILHEAGRFGQELGLSQLHLGGGTNKEEDNPLLFFKSGFSEKRAVYKIGKCIHQEHAYQSLRRAWESNHSITNRILFYR